MKLLNKYNNVSDSSSSSDTDSTDDSDIDNDSDGEDLGWNVQPCTIIVIDYPLTMSCQLTLKSAVESCHVQAVTTELTTKSADNDCPTF